MSFLLWGNLSRAGTWILVGSLLMLSWNPPYCFYSHVFHFCPCGLKTTCHHLGAIYIKTEIVCAFFVCGLKTKSGLFCNFYNHADLFLILLSILVIYLKNFFIKIKYSDLPSLIIFNIKNIERMRKGMVTYLSRNKSRKTETGRRLGDEVGG